MGPTPWAGSNSPVTSARPVAGRDQHQLHRRGAASVTSTDGSTLGAIYYPTNHPACSHDPFYTSGPGQHSAAHRPPAVAYPTYLPDVTNNPLHGFESFRFPNQAYDTNPQAHGPMPTVSRHSRPRGSAAVPVDLNLDMRQYASVQRARPRIRPTTSRSMPPIHSDGLNEADEMNLYHAQPAAGFSLRPERPRMALPPAGRRRRDRSRAGWLSSRRSASPTGIDGLRRRRLFSLDTWDLNNFVWTNDNPANAFPTNSRFTRRARCRLHATATLASPAPASTPADQRRASTTPSPGPARQEDQPQLSRCRSRTTPTSRSARNGSARPISSSSRSCRPRRSTRPKSWPSSASS